MKDMRLFPLADLIVAARAKHGNEAGLATAKKAREAAAAKRRQAKAAAVSRRREALRAALEEVDAELTCVRVFLYGRRQLSVCLPALLMKLSLLTSTTKTQHNKQN
jgi:hypothetical protein